MLSQREFNKNTKKTRYQQPPHHLHPHPPCLSPYPPRGAKRPACYAAFDSKPQPAPTPPSQTVPPPRRPQSATPRTIPPSRSTRPGAMGKRHRGSRPRCSHDQSACWSRPAQGKTAAPTGAHPPRSVLTLWISRDTCSKDKNCTKPKWRPPVVRPSDSDRFGTASRSSDDHTSATPRTCATMAANPSSRHHASSAPSMRSTSPTYTAKP